MKYLKIMKSKFSILFIVLFFSLCSNSSDLNSDKIIISNLDLEPLLENVDVNQLDTNFLIINYFDKHLIYLNI